MLEASGKSARKIFWSLPCFTGKMYWYSADCILLTSHSCTEIYYGHLAKLNSTNSDDAVQCRQDGSYFNLSEACLCPPPHTHRSMRHRGSENATRGTFLIIPGIRVNSLWEKNCEENTANPYF